MSPVSRGRKPKKSKKRANKRLAGSPGVGRLPDGDVATGSRVNAPSMAGFQRLMGSPKRPGWFDPAITTVLDGAEVVRSARGPREFEELTAELLGTELYRVLDGEHRGLWFAWWFEELVAAAAARVEEAGPGAGETPFWLLHGLASIGTPGLASTALAARDRVRKSLADGADVPDWLDNLPRVVATGEVFRMRDAYGTRFAVIAGFSYGGSDPSVFLFDIDASGFVKLVGAGVFDDEDQAADAWRATVGDAAEHAHLRLVDDARELLCLLHCDVGDEAVMGDESRSVIVNWFRAQRRIHDLAEALDERGMPLPAVESLYHDLDTIPMTDQFTSWYTDKHGIQPDSEAVGALAAEWMAGAVPETWYSASPRRVEFQLTLINDWVSDHPVTLAVKSLLPEWVSWLGERAGLPEHLREPVVTAALSGVPSGQQSLSFS